MAASIEPIAVSDMRRGDHLCFSYSSEEERARVMVPYIRAGLAGGDKVLYIADSATEEVLGLLRACTPVPQLFVDAGQLVLVHADDTYLANGVFDPDAMIELLMNESAKAVSEGFRGLRTTGETSWALRLPSIEQFIFYEREVARVFAEAPALAICQYDRNRFPVSTLQRLHATHQGHVGPDPDFADDQVRIIRTWHPHGFRIIGNLSAAQDGLLTTALARLDDVAGDIHLELSRLDQIDLDGLRILLAAAARRAPAGSIVLDNLGVYHRRLLELTRWDHAPGMVINYTESTAVS